MDLKTIVHPVTGKTFKMGWRPRKIRGMCLALGNYLLASLPPAPTAVDYFGSPTYPVLKDVMGNDDEGDCTCAGIVHIIGSWLANVGAAVALTAQNALDLYQKACGWVPGDPSTDQGGDEQDVLNYVKANGIPPDGDHKITAWARVAASNVEQVKQAIFLFGNVYFGFGLYDAWVNPMPSGDGFVWDVPAGAQPDSSNGHCFTAETKVSLLDGRELSFGDLAAGAAGGVFWVYSCDEAGNVVPGRAHSPRLTRRDTDIVRVILDDGSEIRCTPDHRFLTRDGLYREARSLDVGASLMPLYRRVNHAGYEEFLNPRTEGWRSTHRTVAFGGAGRNPAGMCAHHWNFQKRDNSPNNLVPMTKADHARLHYETGLILAAYAKSERGRATSRDLMLTLWADSGWRAKMEAAISERTSAGGRANIANGGGFAGLDPAFLKAVQRENGTKAVDRLMAAENQAKAAAGLRRRFEADPAFRAEARERAIRNLAAANGRPLTAAQIDARRQTIAIARAARTNHKVAKIEAAGCADVYDMTVDKHHNFALSAGVFVHNCFVGLGYNEQGVIIDTWGMKGIITWAAVAKAGELYTLFGVDSIAKASGKSPAGFDATQLAADIQAYGG